MFGHIRINLTKILMPCTRAFFIFSLVFSYIFQFSYTGAVNQSDIYSINNHSYAIGDEIVEMRTETGKTTYLGTSAGKTKFALDSSVRALHYKDDYSNASEQWKNIDLTIVNGQITKAPYILTIDYQNKIITIRDKKTNSTAIVGITSIDGKLVTVQSSVTNKNKVTFSNAAIDTDIVIEASASGVRFKRILKSDKAPLAATFNLAKIGEGIKVDYQARDASTGISNLKVETTLNNGVLTETIDRSKTTVKYPLEIDPTFTVRVAADADNCLVYWSGAAWVLTSAGNGFIGYYDATDYKNGVGSRFLNVTIPNAATITTAYITFTAAGTNNLNNVNCKIVGDLEASADNFTTIANYQSRRGTDVGGANNNLRTVAEVAWNAIGAWTVDTEYDTPEIKTVIQEIVNQGTWVSGNNMVLFVDDHVDGSTHTNNTYRKTYSHAVNAAKAPLVHIEYTSVTPPTVTTQAASSVEENTLVGNGTLTDNGTKSVTYRGICYNTAINPTIANSHVGDNSTAFALGAFTENLTSLSAGTLYYVRAFAMSSDGYGYGENVTALTKPDEPTAFTATAGDNQTSLAWTKAASADNTTIRYETDGTYPTDYNDGTSAYNGTGNSYTHTGLLNGTTYRYRMWSIAIEGGLIQYSDLYASAEATPAAVPTVTTQAATSVEETTATANGTITDLRGAGNCSVRGVEYDTDSGAPYALDVHENGAFGVAAFSENLTALTKGELYYYRAYATNVNGNGYGAEVTFLTKPDEPNTFVVTAVSDVQISLTWVLGTGADNTTVTAKLGSYPANIADGTQVYTSTGNSYNHVGLTAGQHWYYRAWSSATEGGLTQYSDLYAEGNAMTFVAPTVTTGYCTGSSTNWLVVNGNVTALGSPASVTQRGFDYGLTAAYGSSVLTTGSPDYAIGAYAQVLPALLPSTMYHYRAKAFNGLWGYGADMTASTEGSPMLFLSYDTTSDNGTRVGGAEWSAQTFTTDNITSRTVTSIGLKLARTGNPGNVTVSLRRSNGSVPINVDLASGTLSGNTMSTVGDWYFFTMSTEVSLEFGAQYAIVANATAGDNTTNYVTWKNLTAGGYTGGTGLISHDAATTWTIIPNDFLFQLWGNQCLQIQDAKVFQSFKETGDWLVAVRYIDIVAPYYDTYDIKKYFTLQFVDSTGTVKAQTTIPKWGNSVANIYMSAAQVTALTWGGDYRVRIQSLFGAYPYREYALQNTDWLGDDLTHLDSWVLTSAAIIGTYSGTTMTTYIASRGEVLNATGGSIFSSGINGLSNVRPEVFQIYTQQTAYTPNPTTQTYRQTLSNWQVNWGADGTVMLTRLGNMIGMDGGFIGMLFFVIMTIGIIVLAFPAGHTTASFVLSIGVLFAGVFFGLDLIYLILIGLVAAFLLFKQMFMDK